MVMTVTKIAILKEIIKDGISLSLQCCNMYTKDHYPRSSGSIVEKMLSLILSRGGDILVKTKWVGYIHNLRGKQRVKDGCNEGQTSQM